MHHVFRFRPKPLIRAAFGLLAILMLPGTQTWAQEPSATAQPRAACPAPYFATGFDRAPTLGSRDALIAAVQRGETIRVGWDLDFDRDGASDLTHWAQAAYLSVFEGQVFTQVSAIHAQRPMRGEADIRLPQDYEEWRGSLSTTGQLQGAFSSGRSFPDDIQVAIQWCPARPPAPSWTVVYKNGLQGEDLAGSKEALFAAIRSGRPIRIGWGFRTTRNGETISVEHAIDPVFLSITGGEHVSAQLPEHIAQRSYWNSAEPFFDDAAVMWRGLMSTRGSFDAVWVHRGTGEVLRRLPQRAALTWYAGPATPGADVPVLAMPGGVTRDEDRADEVILPAR